MGTGQHELQCICKCLCISHLHAHDINELKTAIMFFWLSQYNKTPFNVGITCINVSGGTYIYIYTCNISTQNGKKWQCSQIIKRGSRIFSQGVGGVRMKNMLTHVINCVFRSIQKLNKLITLSLIFVFFFFFLLL